MLTASEQTACPRAQRGVDRHDRADAGGRYDTERQELRRCRHTFLTRDEVKPTKSQLGSRPVLEWSSWGGSKHVQCCLVDGNISRDSHQRGCLVLLQSFAVVSCIPVHIPVLLAYLDLVHLSLTLPVVCIKVCVFLSFSSCQVFLDLVLHSLLGGRCLVYLLALCRTSFPFLLNLSFYPLFFSFKF